MSHHTSNLISSQFVWHQLSHYSVLNLEHLKQHNLLVGHLGVVFTKLSYAKDIFGNNLHCYRIFMHVWLFNISSFTKQNASASALINQNVTYVVGYLNIIIWYIIFPLIITHDCASCYTVKWPVGHLSCKQSTLLTSLPLGYW